MTKVCPNPHCEAVFHNCHVKDTRCLDCSGQIMLINEETFFKKFSDNWFQYDYQTGEYLRKQKPLPAVIQLSLF
jgi:hypothetical protein